MMVKNEFNPRLECSTLVELLKKRAFFQGKRTAYTFLVDGEEKEEKITYSELDKKARCIASKLKKKAEAGHRILLLYPPGLEFIAAFFGCLYAGMIAIPSYPPKFKKSDSRLEAIIRDSKPSVVLTNQQILLEIISKGSKIAGLDSLEVIDTDNMSPEAIREWVDTDINKDAIAFLQYTSGSTSKPKGVMVTHRNILYNQEMIKQAFGHTEDSILVGWLPFFHDMGLIGNILQPMYTGFQCILLSPAQFFQKPFRWLKAISKYQGNTSGGPNFSYDLCVEKILPEQMETLDLSCWNIAFNGAEPVRAQTMDQFYHTFKKCGFKKEAFYPCYGMAETTLFVSGGEKGQLYNEKCFDTEFLEKRKAVLVSPNFNNSRSLVGCGRTIMEQKIVIVDPKTQSPTYPSGIGEIWVKGENVASGYWDKPEETLYTFGARLDSTNEGPFLRTGDLGFFEENELFIAGRLKDLIIIRGRNLYPQDIELSVEGCHEALAPNSGAAFSILVGDEEQLVIVHELKSSHRKANAEEIFDNILQITADELGIHPFEVVLIKPFSIPKTSSGKIQRHLCKKYYQEGNLQVISRRKIDFEKSKSHWSMEITNLDSHLLFSVESVEDRINLLLGYITNLTAGLLKTTPEKLDVKKPLVSLGLDSLLAVELQHQIEAIFHVQISAGELLSDVSIQMIANETQEKLELKRNKSEVHEFEELPPIESDGKSGGQPLSYEQERIWMLEQVSPGYSSYHIPLYVHLKGNLELPILKSALNTILSRHEALRTTFVDDNGVPEQKVLNDETIKFSVIDLSYFDDLEKQEEVQRRICEETMRPFNLKEGPLYRISILRLGSEEHIFLLIMHHIVSDIASAGLILKELSILYEALLNKHEPVLPELEVQYRDFASWQRKNISGEFLDEKLKYWKNRLEGVSGLLKIPTDSPRPKVRSGKGEHYYFTIQTELTRSIRSFSMNNGVTTYMVLLAAFNVMLCKYSGQRDILVGTPVNGRINSKLYNLVGFFAYPIVIRTDLRDNLGFEDLIKQTRKNALEAYENAEAPFSEVVRVVNPERNTNYTPLFQVMFSFVKSPLSDLYMPEITLSRVNVEKTAADFDLFLTVIDEGDKLQCAFGYSTELFEKQTVENLAQFYISILDECIKNPSMRINQLKLPFLLEQKVEDFQKENNKRSIWIASSFTAEPIQKTLEFWLKKLNIPAEISFAPYNQVFQQLIDPLSSLKTNNCGINIVLVRIQDWFRYNKESQEVKSKLMYEAVNEFIPAVRSAIGSSESRYIICICPSNDKTGYMMDVINEMEHLLVEGIRGISNVCVVQSSEITGMYPLDECYDEYTDKIAHIPYTNTFFTALGTIISRKIYSMNHPPYKVIILDCDNTLWKGICGEDGPEGVKITPTYKAFQEFLIDQYNSGMLLCLCSKNNEEDVWQVFDKQHEMPLKKKHFILSRINWNAKSGNIIELSQELGLGLDSFIFIDDNPVECKEVSLNCPEVLTLNLPINEEDMDIMHFVKNIWAFDHLFITSEDAKRSDFYRENIERDIFKQNTASYETFLSELNLEISIEEMVIANIPRVCQLIQRTNQFNFTTKRRSESEIETLCIHGHLKCHCFNVRDRFGDYGLVGIIIFSKDNDELDVDTFLLSCRALGRGVEHKILSHLADIAAKMNCSIIRIPFIPTEKNQPAFDFIESVASQHVQTTEKGYLYNIPTEDAKDLSLVNREAERDKNYNNQESKINSKIKTIPLNQLSELFTLIAKDLSDMEELSDMVYSENKNRKNNSASYTAPSTPTEKKLAEIWCEVLSVEKIGIDDDFFELGGHSILATQILSRVRKIFKVEIPMKTLFTGTFTIAKLAREVTNQQLKSFESHGIAEKIKLLNSLSDNEIKKILSKQ